MSKTSKPRVLGLDIGHTIYDNPNKRPFPDAFRVIKRLGLEVFGPENMCIVSRVTPEQEVRARAFVQSASFQSEVGIPIERTHFCRERHEKARICIQFGITEFVDDRPGVHMHMPWGIRRILYNPTEQDLHDYAYIIHTMEIVSNWIQLERLFIPT
jgi:hypothetical protein